ncbi:RING-H2 zinc finger domain-containing protein [Trichoderma breve]|uniref:DSC E3 ubiquitin ligase complex subunit A n=1 Tax=Trichoderma breve TaxID=2034170 RepID=A0A9W9E697_9HYPO|nr:RING-H2 zinc finger domain-containing protein [Trichoderma breve]KAJ4856206.1 RING-H2 zinc finger domain-containing protein [Trichoderma breve]
MPLPELPAYRVLGIIFILWWMLPGSEYQSQSIALSDLVVSRLEHYRASLDVLNTTRWGDFAPLVEEGDGDHASPKYVNLTGFREKDHLSWQDLGRFRERGLQLSRHAMPAVGGEQLWDVAQGEPETIPRTYESYNLSESVPSMHWIGDKTDWARNVTGSTGRIQLSTADAPLSGGLIRNVKAVVTFEDTEGSGLSWEMVLFGKFDGVFGLPHLTPGPDYFQSSQRFLNESLEHTIATKEKNIYSDQSIPWKSNFESPLHTRHPSPHCEYVMYLQTHPPSRQSLGLGSAIPKGENMAEMLQAIESELESPLGAPIKHIPKLQMSAVIYSPDCGLFMESKGPPDYPRSEADHLLGVKFEVQISSINHWLLAYAVMMFGQVILLKGQMKETYTPSTLGRASFWTISMMLIADGMTFSAAASWVATAQYTFLPTLTLTFASFMSMTIGGSLLAKIHEVQTPQPRARREGPQGTASPNSESASPILPGPVTAGRGLGNPAAANVGAAASIADGASAVPGALPAAARPIVPPTQTATFQSLMGRFVLVGALVMFISVSSIAWYMTARSWFLNICAFVYLSMWIPQIYRNIIRNCRRALKWQFVIGQSLLRLLPLAYFWLKPDNFLLTRTEPRAFALLGLWVWLQIFVLATQDAVGPRFGIPKGWMPDAWDYHPVLREDNVEAGGLPIGLGAEDSPGRDRRRSSEDRDKTRPGDGTTRAIDCAICREVLEVPVVKAGEEDMSVTGVFSRRMYMVTPCRHIFHTPCLESWMKFRLQCPICREDLPPI